MSKEKKERKPFNETGFGKFVKKAAEALPEVADAVFDIIGGPYDKGYDLLRGILSDSNDIKSRPLLKEMSAEERNWRLEIEKIELEYFKTAVEDTANARAKEMAYLNAGKLDYMQILVGLGIMAAFGFCLYVSVYRSVDDSMQSTFSILFGIVQMSMAGLVGYYFGSSKGSKDKTKIISKLEA